LHLHFDSMSESEPLAPSAVTALPWDARLARRLVRPLSASSVTPNHLTSVRLAFGIGAALAFARSGYGWMNLGALLIVVSNFLDHTDGELARMSGKSSRLGHWYDLASDAAVTILLFSSIGVGVGRQWPQVLGVAPLALGVIAGLAVALIFFLRMRIEGIAGKAASRQGRAAGFETEDVLYLVPLVTLLNGARGFLIAAAIGAPLFALWVLQDYRRVLRRHA
jgi:archaetidylinositol phosphate synthase